MALPAQDDPLEIDTVEAALSALRSASRARHAAIAGSREHEAADAEESRLQRLVWDLADRRPSGTSPASSPGEQRRR